ncbi:unnamed protein product, partial [Closterium sp. NIES-53]
CGAGSVYARVHIARNASPPHHHTTIPTPSHTPPQEVLQGIRMVRCFSQQEWEHNRFALLTRHCMHMGVTLAFRVGLLSGAVYAGAGLAVVVVFAYGAYLTMVRAMGAAERVLLMLNMHPRMPLHGNRCPPMGGEGPCLLFDRVWFAYPSRPEHWVIKGLQLALPWGRTVALVGASGGGKSTLLSLALRLYDPSAGRILLAGVPLPDIDSNYLHSKVPPSLCLHLPPFLHLPTPAAGT